MSIAGWIFLRKTRKSQIGFAACRVAFHIMLSGVEIVPSVGQDLHLTTIDKSTVRVHVLQGQITGCFQKGPGGRKGQSGATYHTITCVQCGAIKRKHGDGHMDFCNQQCLGDYIFHQWKTYGVQHHNSWNVFPKILKRRLLEEAGYQCQAIRSDTGERCTESRRRPNGSSILEVEHKDGDSTNNAYDNIELLCPSCHSLTPTYRAGNWGKSTRTWRRVAKT